MRRLLLLVFRGSILTVSAALYAAALFRAAYLRRYLQLHHGSRSQIEAMQLSIAVARVGAVGRGVDQRPSAYVKRLSLGSV